MVDIVSTYCLFVNNLTGSRYKAYTVVFSLQFWPSFFMFICAKNSGVHKIFKILVKIILRVFYSIETTARCVFESMPYLPHPRNIINGAEFIGKNVILYHNVTIGAKRIDVNFQNRPRIEGGCVIATGAVVVGSGTLGSNSIVKANSLVVL